LPRDRDRCPRFHREGGIEYQTLRAKPGGIDNKPALIRPCFVNRSPRFRLRLPRLRTGQPEAPVSPTPLQALKLTNRDVAVEQGEFIAKRAGTITRAFELSLSGVPAEDAPALCEGTKLELVNRSLINSYEFAFLP